MTSDRDLVTEEEQAEELTAEGTEQSEESLLWEYLEEGDYDYQRPRRGDLREGIILRKDVHQIIVDIGAKREGLVPETDLEKLGPEAVAELKVGDEVPVYVLKPENRDGDVIVSINIARQKADWARAEELMEADEILEKEVTGHNKGGLLVEFGNLQGFLPRSHIVNLDSRTQPGPPQERLRQMMGEEIPVKIIEVNQRQRRLIVSERAAWREWRAEQKKRLLANLEVGDVRTGTVTSLADFGAFVDLGGADGLIHLSELSWDRGKKPKDVVGIGDEIEVKVISLERERQRIGLSLKQLKPDPWVTLEERYAVGQYIDVEVTNLAKFGAFARLEEGIEGLIHISELAEHNVQHPSEVTEPSQQLTVQILSLEPERKRVGLSLRRVPDHLRTPVEVEAAEEEAPAAPETTDVNEAEPAAPATVAEADTTATDEEQPEPATSEPADAGPEDAQAETTPAEAEEEDQIVPATSPNGDKVPEEETQVVKA